MATGNYYKLPDGQIYEMKIQWIPIEGGSPLRAENLPRSPDLETFAKHKRLLMEEVDAVLTLAKDHFDDDMLNKSRKEILKHLRAMEPGGASG